MNVASLPWLGLALLFVAVVLLVIVACTRPPADRMLAHLVARGNPDAVATSGPRVEVAEPVRRLAARAVSASHFESRIAGRLEAAGITLTVSEWLLRCLGAGTGVALICGILSGFRVAVIAAGAAFAAIVPPLLIRRRSRRRRAEFAEALPDALQALAGSLASSHSLTQALDIVACRSVGSVRSEMLRALAEMRLGRSREDALGEVATRMSSREFEWVVMAMRINRDHGGNLGEILRTTAATMRERARVRRQVRVLSAEGRLSAWIIGSLPLALVGYLSLTRTEYVELLLTTPLGLAMAGGGALLMGAGIVWMSRIVRIEG